MTIAPPEAVAGRFPLGMLHCSLRIGAVAPRPVPASPNWAPRRDRADESEAPLVQVTGADHSLIRDGASTKPRLRDGP